MNVNTRTSQTNTDIMIMLVDKNHTSNSIVENLIETKSLDASSAGNTYLSVTESNGELVKNLYVTIGELVEFTEATGNIDKVATAIVNFMKPECNNQVLIHTDNDAIAECGITSLVSSLITANYEFSIVPKEDSLVVSFLVEEKQEETVQGMIFNGVAIGESVNYTRRLGDLPSNICTPTYLAERAIEDFADLPVEISGFGESDAEDLGMGGFLSVSVGSEEEGRVITFDYQGGNDGDAAIVLVGKAVTFDSGGISIKPSASMEEMKYDMCGGATVFGIMKAAATLGIRKNIRGIVGAVENMPSGKATKPGDVITMKGGKTVEVTNTDAEGRMVLADLLTYVGDNYDAHTVIDFATLTGACCVALGDHAAGMFTENDTLADRLYASGQKTNDKCWRLPMWEEYNKQMDSGFADIGNTGTKGAGASTAACFLNRFASEYDYTYAHMDIAGVAWSKKATGRPVKMMIDFLSSENY